MTEITNNVVNKKSGKLSSRNTRRKRRDNRDNSSAKKSKAPIPSFAFTPIIEDDEEVEESEELTLRSEQRVVANDAKSLSIAATTNIADEEIKQQEKSPHESVDDNDDKKAAATSAAANSNGNLLETNDAGSNNSMDVNSIQCNKTSACQNVVLKEVTELTISQKTSKQTDQNLTDPARTEKDNHRLKNEADSKTKTTRKTVYDMLEVAECKMRSASCSKSSTAGETIEILDDEEDKKDLPLVSRNNSSVSRDSEANAVDKPRMKTDPISVESSDEDGTIDKKTTNTIATKKRKKPTRRKANTGKSKVEIKSATNDDTTSDTQKKPRKKAKLCTACASCQCQKDGSAATSSLQKLSQLSGSDARVEQTLKNRMLKIERNLALTEGQRHDCARELKRHRCVIQKKMAKTGANTKKRQHFLADAQISDEMAEAFATARVDQKKVKQTKNYIFGKSSSKKEPQPTLTQMFGGGDCSEREGDRSDDDGDMSSADEISQADEPHDPLSFWNNNESIHKDPFLGSMAQFEEATIRFKNKQLQSTAVWAKATASVIKNETISQSRKKEEDEVEEGIDALLELFDISPEKRPDPTNRSQDDDDECIIMSQLSQAGVKAVEGITEEIVSDGTKRSAIERTCPQWKENIEYSFRHTDSDSLEKALIQVKKEKQRLEAVKERILQAFLDRSSTLEVYEKAIEGSLQRLAEKENENT